MPSFVHFYIYQFLVSIATLLLVFSINLQLIYNSHNVQKVLFIYVGFYIFIIKYVLRNHCNNYSKLRCHLSFISMSINSLFLILFPSFGDNISTANKHLNRLIFLPAISKWIGYVFFFPSFFWFKCHNTFIIVTWRSTNTIGLQIETGGQATKNHAMEKPNGTFI